MNTRYQQAARHNHNYYFMNMTNELSFMSAMAVMKPYNFDKNICLLRFLTMFREYIFERKIQSVCLVFINLLR